jgi:ubiquinone/menaquinone biosynthesis C-methylase UbiE
MAYTLVAEQSQEHEIIYGNDRVSEIEQGTAVCRSCAARYPIEGYVLSFAARLAPGIRADGAYWGEFYARLYDHGITGFLDTRSQPAPYLSMGVPQTLPFDGEEWGGIHMQLAEHRWVQPGGRIVDVGVGSGWSSLFLARRGFEVIAFDPAQELMQLAKRYAIAQGVFLEYICADMANFVLRPESVDAVFALHSLHHVPDLEDGMRRVHRMLKSGGCLALDDHFQDVQMLDLLRSALIQDAEERIFPALRDPRLRQDPQTNHSENEGVGMGQVLPAIERYLHIDQVDYRHIALDFVGPLFYLEQGCKPEALQYATQVTDLIKRAMKRVWQDQVEYITLVAQKRAELPAEMRYSPGPQDPSTALHQRIVAQEQELGRLHLIVAEKNAHIQRIERLLERVENGRLMRLLRWAGGK